MLLPTICASGQDIADKASADEAVWIVGNSLNARILVLCKRSHYIGLLCEVSHFSRGNECHVFQVVTNRNKVLVLWISR